MEMYHFVALLNLQLGARDYYFVCWDVAAHGVFDRKSYRPRGNA